MPLFRRGFTVGKPVRHAVISISGLGHYQLSINGRETTASLLNPGWTDYRKTVLYNSYDVTEMLQPGANALGVMLGNGMRSEEHTSELQSLMRISYAVFCLKKKRKIIQIHDDMNNRPTH